jgi:hypothetical protein
VNLRVKAAEEGVRPSQEEVGEVEAVVVQAYWCYRAPASRSCVVFELVEGSRRCSV